MTTAQMSVNEYEIKHVGLEIGNLKNHRRGQKVLNALLASSGEMFRSKRGREAVVIKVEIFEKLCQQLKISSVESDDGLRRIILPEEPHGTGTDRSASASPAPGSAAK